MTKIRYLKLSVIASVVVPTSVELSDTRGILSLSILPSIGVVNQIYHTTMFSNICTLCHADRISLLLFKL